MLHNVFFPMRTVPGTGSRGSAAVLHRAMFPRAFEPKDKLPKPVGSVPASPEPPVLVQDGNQNYKSPGSGFVEIAGK